MNNIPESVRQRIKELIEGASSHINMGERVKHLLIQICYEMYKAGYKDSFRVIEASIQVQKDLFNGKG